MELDIYEFCSPELQSKMKVFRDNDAKKVFESVGSSEKKTEENTEVIMDDESKTKNLSEDGELGVGIPAGFKGHYQLFSAVTHKGRSSDSGHYIGWGLQNREKDEWMCFDDSEVSPCKSEHILELKGGGDYDMAYLLFYKYKEP